ncbi:MAG: glycosyl hydrolase 2 galactose-binding domain-containing protein [Vibrio sp.]
MQFSLAGPWQLSPLTDLSIPQDDITFPAPLSLVLPATCSETEIVQQEWHLMHDIEVDEALLSFVAIDFVLAGIEHYAEVRLNGVALFDCDGSQAVYRKEIRQWLQLGRNRFEILFLHADDESLLDEPVAAQCRLDQPVSFVEHQPLVHDPRVGIWQAPYLQGLRHLRLTHVSTEQVWHHGGCELLVNLFFTTYASGLVAAAVKFDGRTYQVPIDMRSNHASVLFQVDAPKIYDQAQPNAQDLYLISVQLDGQTQHFQLALSEAHCVSHFPL